MDRVRSVPHSYGNSTAVWRSGSQTAGAGAGKAQAPAAPVGGQSAPEQDSGGHQASQEETREQLYARRDEERGEFFVQQGSGRQPVRERLFLQQKEGRESADARGEGKEEASKMTPAQKRAQEQFAAWRSAQELLARQQKEKEESEKGESIISKLLDQAQSIKEAFDPKNKKNLYDATMDLTLISQMEKIPPLKAMQARILFKIRSVKTSGAKSSEIRIALNKLKKVLGKVKAKVKNLKKEEQLETSRKKAEEARRKAKEEALRRELELRKKVRKAKEQKDIEESKMGLGANYGGPGEAAAPELAMDVHTSLEAAAPSLEAGAVMDVAVADMGAAAVDAGGAVDVSL